MRIYEGDYAYEVERSIDPATQLHRSWRYNIYRIRPADRLLRSGETSTKETAETEAKRVLEEVLATDEKSPRRRVERAA